MTPPHLTFEQISELAESTASESSQLHLAECESCRASLSRVRELLTAAHALPREIAPPPEVWSAVRARVATETRASSPVRWWHNGWLASAAAIVLIVGTMTLTTRFASRGKAAKAKAMIVNTAAESPALFAVDKNYVVTIRELRETLESQRPSLSPSTIQTVERSLRIIDDAIAEARAALAADPANQALVDILASHYERQVDLLQRAAELSSSL